MVGEGNEAFLMRVWKPLPSRRVLKPLAMHNGLKRTIFACSGLELLEMVLELEIGWCVNEDVGPSNGWIVRSHVRWRGE